MNHQDTKNGETEGDNNSVSNRQDAKSANDNDISDSALQQHSTDRSKVVYILWAIGFGLLLAVGFICWFFVAPMLEARSLARNPIYSHVSTQQTLQSQPSPGTDAPLAASIVVRELDTKKMVAVLGGEERAARGIKLYLRFLSNDSDQGMEQWMAYNILSACGRPAIPTFLGLAQNQDKDLRGLGVGCLGACAAECGYAEAVPVLCCALSDPDRDVRAIAAGALGQIGALAAEAAPELRSHLVDDSPTVMTAAARALWQVTGKQDESVAALEKLLNHEDDVVRVSAKRLITRIKGLAPKEPRTHAD